MRSQGQGAEVEQRCRICGSTSVRFRSPTTSRCMVCAPPRALDPSHGMPIEVARVLAQRWETQQRARERRREMAARRRRVVVEEPEEPTEVLIAARFIAEQLGVDASEVLDAGRFPALYHQARRKLLPWFGGDHDDYEALKRHGALLAEALEDGRQDDG